MLTTLFASFKKNALLITPNQRLTATLLKQFNHYQIQQGHVCWPHLPIMPLARWTQTLWAAHTTEVMELPFLLLTPNQELIIWEEIITQSPESEALLKISDLAKQAKSAWTTLKLWRTDFHHPSFALTENSRAFQRWADQFAARCQQEKWCDTASLADILIEKIQQKIITPPQELVLLNFTEINPQLRELLNVCENQGSHIEYQHCHTQENTVAQIALANEENEENEIHIMARWAKKILNEHPSATIGCIAAQLEDKREMIIAEFTEILGSSDYFNISAGQTLLSYPIIQSALQLLALPLQTVNLETLTFLLHNPFISNAEKEMPERIQFDRSLRRQNITTAEWKTLPSPPPLFIHQIFAYLQQRETQRSPQPISTWVRLFAQLLETLGWPGEKSLNSAEYQVVQSWLNLLKETAGFESILPPLSYNKALHYLTVLLSKTYFQPQSPDAPVHILGQLEGAGIPFDYLWVMGLDDTAWPPAPSPNPFIPHELQKRLQMPNSTGDRELEYSLRLTQQFKQSASTVIFSYAQRNEKQELRPSSLIANLNSITLQDLSLQPHLSLIQHLFASQLTETLVDQQAPAILPHEKIRGGVAIFEMQAACPFKAFAKQRLDASTIEEPLSGLPGKNRGSIVHRVMELFWREVQDQRTLLQLSAEQLKTKTTHYIAVALKELAPFIRKESLYSNLVSQRLEALLTAWINLEKARPPFRVLAQEQEKVIHLANLAITLRIDRVDELGQGEQFIIDYKTKKTCDTKDWFGERPAEPQLPLYCITNPQQTVGIAFAQMHALNSAFNGIAQKPLAIAGIKSITEKSNADHASWETQLQQWRITLTQLVDDFQNGRAIVDPKNAEETCRYCDLQTLCRVYE